jgi:hypothetical protein
MTQKFPHALALDLPANPIARAPMSQRLHENGCLGIRLANDPFQVFGGGHNVAVSDEESLILDVRERKSHSRRRPLALWLRDERNIGHATQGIAHLPCKVTDHNDKA